MGPEKLIDLLLSELTGTSAGQLKTKLAGLMESEILIPCAESPAAVVAAVLSSCMETG